MRIPIILLNFNSSADCRKCISYLKRQQGVELEIIIVDNCSQLDDQKTVEQLCKEQGCTFIPAKENRGYNTGNNIGLRYAISKGYKYALIANPDMEFPQTDYIVRLIEVMEQDKTIAVCGSNIEGLDGKRQSPRSFTTYWTEVLWFVNGLRKLINRKHSIILNPQNQYCDILMGSCIFVRTSFIKQIGYLDENIFLYCEEPILGKQVVAAGMRMYYLHNATAVHAHVESQKGSFVKRHDLYWHSRWYYLSHYAGYSRCQLALMWFSKKLFYIFKRITFIICGIE